MADCSRPPQAQQKNLAGVFGFRNKGAYDDVFASRPKMRAPAFTPALKDYAEIFNCAKTSSIPVLDLDEFQRRDVDQVDYGNVFGGFSEAKIGSSYEEVFSVVVGGVRKTHDSHSQSKGSALSTAEEDSQRLPRRSLSERKHSMSSDKITLREKGYTNEPISQTKISEVPVPARAFNEAVPLKKASDSRSSAITNKSKPNGDEVPEGKHSRRVSSSEHPKHNADVFIEIDMRSGNGYGSDKSVSSDMQMNNDIIRPSVQMPEATSVTDASLHLRGSMATSDNAYRYNAREEGHGGLNNLAQDVHVQSIHGPDKPFTSESTKDEHLVKHIASRPNISPGLTHDHGGALGTPEVTTGNSSARNSNDDENAKGDRYSCSQQDVKFKINNSEVNSSEVRRQEGSKSTPATHSQYSLSKMKGSIDPEITDREGRNRDSVGHRGNSVESKDEAKNLEPAMNKPSTLKPDVSKRSTYISFNDNNLPCSSDDVIDRTSEASVSAAAVKKAIKDAQALINIAKESNGVKGFMSFVMARNSGQVKVAKEEHNSKVKENAKPAQAEIQNDFSKSSVKKDTIAPWPVGSEAKMAPAHTVVEELNLKGTEFSSYGSFSEKLQEPATTQHAPSSAYTFEDKLAVEKLVHIKDNATLNTIFADAGQVSFVPVGYCSLESNAEKKETEVNSSGHEALYVNNHESCTGTKITEAGKESQKAVDSSNKGFMMHSFQDNVQTKVGCSANSFGVKLDSVAITEHIHSNQKEAISVEREGHVLRHSTSLEEENVEESELDPLDQVLDCEDMDSANRFEVKQDAIAVTEDIHINLNETINVVGHVLSDSTLSEEENSGEFELDPHDQVLDCKDMDSANHFEVKQDGKAGTEHIPTNLSEAIKVESVDHVLSDSTSPEEENVGEVVLDQHEQVLDCEDMDSANHFEVKQDGKAGTEHIPTNLSEAIKVESVDHVLSDSTSPEEENVGEVLDQHDQVLDCADTDSEDYASAEENWVSTDSDEEFADKDHHFSAPNNLDEIEEMEKMVVPEVTVISQGVLLPNDDGLHEDQIVGETNNVPLQNILTKEAQESDEKTLSVFPVLDENPVVEETEKTKEVPLPNMVTRDAQIASEEVTASILNEDPIVEEAVGGESVALHNMPTHEVEFTSEETTVRFFNYSDEDPIVEEADIREDASVLCIMTPKAKVTSENGGSWCFDSGNGDQRVETEGTEDDTTEQNMVTHEATIILENNVAPSFDNSNQDWIVEDNAEDTTSESRVSLTNKEHDKETGGGEKLHGQTSIKIEKSDCVARAETESGSCCDHESSHHEGSEVEQISIDDLAEESGADAFEESRPTPWTFEPQKHEVDGTNFCNLDHQIQDREEFEQLNDAGVRADATEDIYGAMNVTGFKKDHVSVDAAGKEDATETDSTSCGSEHVSHELEAEVQLFEPVPDSSKNKETTEFEQLSENCIQQVERHGRRKWEIPRETFELLELEIRAPEIEDIIKQDNIEMERQMDKHERKKWEIPIENFELPVLGDEIVEENEDHAGHDTERATQSAEKPERKKWKIQKEVFEVPIVCTEAVQDTSEHEGFVIKTPSAEEMGMMDKLLNAVIFPKKMVQHDEVQNEESLPNEGVSREPCSENSEEEIAKKWMSGIKMVSEEETCKQLGETSHQQDTKVGEGKAVGQEDCMKGSGDVNVKEEIKKTLGKIWKKIYSGKQDEDSELVEPLGKENATSKDAIGGGFEKDLNLNGPVELVESPRQQIDVEALISGSRIGNEGSREAASQSEPFEANESSICKSREFVSMETTEVQRNGPYALNSCEYQEDEKESNGRETRDKNYNANHPESQSEASSGLESENWTEMAPNCEAYDLRKGPPKDNFLTSNVHEHRQMGSETVGRSEPLVLDESLVNNAESQSGLNSAHDAISDANMSEVEVEMHRVDVLSDKRCANSKQQDTSSSQQDVKSVPESEVPDYVTQLHGFEQKADKNETYPDNIDQACRWKWIFGDDLRDKPNEQDEAPEVKGKTTEMADEISASITKKENTNGDKPTLMEETAPDSVQKEVNTDHSVLNDLKRAKEIERIAVERAIREARERAFIEARERAAMERANAEARERAAKEKTNLESRERIASERASAEARERAALERANANAHQKVTSNVQERTQRTSSEAKLASDKNTLEAKRRAELERAAVERATTEARQRALEKALSRKEQVTQSSSSRSTSSSNDQYGSSTKDDKPSESALRFKARNERHQRIAERAAKALAEKNMRDLLVQREQAERNRLAEVLDADVKRWARGKTGNLRALLSTLQYILGPDSGWQAIHLTEIVTADAVKKAYRKATLFVHPDKLQQRGATIRQKYICEKVFDLLKEAWNKFDRDER